METSVTIALWILTGLALIASWRIWRAFRGIDVDETQRRAALRVFIACIVPIGLLLLALAIAPNHEVPVSPWTLRANLLACGLGVVVFIVAPLLHERRCQQHRIDSITRERPAATDPHDTD